MLDTLSQLGLVVLQTFVLYAFLVIILNLLGRRQSSELTATELVIIMLIGSSVETGLIAGNVSLAAGLVSAATLLVCNRAFTLLLRRRPALRHFILGHPIALVYKGRFLPARLREAGLTEEDVFEGMRLRGYDRLDQVHLAVLEIDGTISVVPEEKGDRERG